MSITIYEMTDHPSHCNDKNLSLIVHCDEIGHVALKVSHLIVIIVVVFIETNIKH